MPEGDTIWRVAERLRRGPRRSAAGALRGGAPGRWPTAPAGRAGGGRLGPGQAPADPLRAGRRAADPPAHDRFVARLRPRRALDEARPPGPGGRRGRGRLVGRLLRRAGGAHLPGGPGSALAGGAPRPRPVRAAPGPGRGGAPRPRLRPRRRPCATCSSTSGWRRGSATSTSPRCCGTAGCTRRPGWTSSTTIGSASSTRSRTACCGRTCSGTGASPTGPCPEGWRSTGVGAGRASAAVRRSRRGRLGAMARSTFWCARCQPPPIGDNVPGHQG